MNYLTHLSYIQTHVASLIDLLAHIDKIYWSFLVILCFSVFRCAFRNFDVHFGILVLFGNSMDRDGAAQQP